MTASALYELCSDPEVSRLTDWKPHESVQESEDVLRTVFMGTDTWAIVRGFDRRLIGAIGLMADPKRDNPNARMLGYWLGTPYWGLGYATEAAKVVCAEAFEEMGVQLISAYYCCRQYPLSARAGKARYAIRGQTARGISYLGRQNF